jgi:glucose-6-phosphate dehydrogenase assembly protein OpcA
MADKPVALAEFTPVSLADIEEELRRKVAAHGASQAPVLQARMSNLVIFCPQTEVAERVAAEIPAIMEVHPSRVLFLVGNNEGDGPDVRAAVNVEVQQVGGQPVCVEQILLRARDQALNRLPFAVRTLVIGDLPTNLYWASPQPPALSGPLLYDLTEQVQQLVYDSHGWLEPHRGVAATATWLEGFERQPGRGRWRIASDLNWRRLKYWRRVLAQALDPVTAPGALETITEVLIEHGPHAVTRAWQLVGWLASRLGWQVLTARVKPGVEIAWRLHAHHGEFHVRIRRLGDGPSTVQRVRIACLLGGRPGALNVIVEDENRLVVSPEGVQAASRTLNMHQEPLAELLGRQLSDRQPDPVFRESMVVAQVFARSIRNSGG